MDLRLCLRPKSVDSSKPPTILSPESAFYRFFDWLAFCGVAKEFSSYSTRKNNTTILLFWLWCTLLTREFTFLILFLKSDPDKMSWNRFGSFSEISFWNQIRKIALNWTSAESAPIWLWIGRLKSRTLLMVVGCIVSRYKKFVDKSEFGTLLYRTIAWTI